MEMEMANINGGASSHHRKKKGKRRKDDMFVETKAKVVETKAKVQTPKLSIKNLPNLKVKFVTQSAKSQNDENVKTKSKPSVAVGTKIAKTAPYVSSEIQSPTKLKLKLSMPLHSSDSWSSSVNGSNLKIKLNGQSKLKFPVLPQKTGKAEGPKKRLVKPLTVKLGTPGVTQKKSAPRRKVPQFKKVLDLDLYCGTRSVYVQVNENHNECLYCGDENLVQKFLSPQGLSIKDVKEFLSSATDMRKENYACEKAYRENAKLLTGDHSDDDDYTPTSKNRKEIAKEKRKDVQQNLLNGEYIENIEERNRVFRSHKNNLLSKILESDKAHGTKSFVLILNPDLESAVYHGYKEYLAHFFSGGFSSTHLDRKFNVRMYDNDELDPATCSVPHCVVSRNLLSQWRVAAIELFKFPDNLSMTLYRCLEADKKEWAKRLGLDQAYKGRLSVCSLHFEDGAPSKKNPHPSLFLNVNGPNTLQFQGSSLISKDIVEKIENKSEEESPKTSFRKLKSLIPPSDRACRRIYKNYKPFRQTKVSFELKKSKKTKSFCQKLVSRRIALAKQGNTIRCKYCVFRFKSVGDYFKHIMETHFKIETKETTTDCTSKPDHEDTSNQIPELGDILPLQTTDEHPKEKPIVVPADVELSPSEFDEYMKMFYPGPVRYSKKKKSTYLCKSCKLKFSPEKFYTHLRMTHKTFFCVFCDRLFKKFSDIEKHLKLAHQDNVRYFHSAELFEEYAGSGYVLTCGICSEDIDGKELPNHHCNTIGPKIFECPRCPKSFPKQEQLDIHLSNGFCSDPVKNEEEAVKRFKVLTGKEPQFQLLNNSFEKEENIRASILKHPPNGLLKAALSRPVTLKPLKFDVTDKQILSKVKLTEKEQNKTGFDTSLWQELPDSGSIFLTVSAQGVTSEIRKLYKESAHNWVVPVKDTERSNNLTEVLRAGTNFFLESKPLKQGLTVPEKTFDPLDQTFEEVKLTSNPGNMSDLKLRLKMPSVSEKASNSLPSSGISLKISLPSSVKSTPPLKKESKNERVARQATVISNCLDKMSRLIDSLGEKENCLLCQQSKFLTVDTIYLLTHLIVNHNRNDIEQSLGEDPADSILRIRNQLKDLKKEELIFKYTSVTAVANSGLTYNCCFCEKIIYQSYEELFLHLNNQHNSKVLNCCLCQNIFLNYGSFVSHVCFGPTHSNAPVKPKAKFVCPICHGTELSTFLDFQTHVRQIHDVCEICLKPCGNQVNLRSHCLSHSQELMCMKCFVNNENTDQIRKHLFNFHDNEHSTCNKCHQKIWKFVYHFCIAPESTTCEVCDKKFQDFRHYRVHLRTHTGSNPHVCNAKGCKKSYISKQLLLKHQVRRHQELRAYAAKILEDKRTQRLLAKYGAKNLESLQIVETVIMDLVDEAIRQSESIPNTPDPEEIEKEPEAEQSKYPSPDASRFLDPVDAAVRSIMGPEGSFSLDLSPTKDLSSLLHPTPLHELDPELSNFNSNLHRSASEDLVNSSPRPVKQSPNKVEQFNDVPDAVKSILEETSFYGPDKLSDASNLHNEIFNKKELANSNGPVIEKISTLVSQQPTAIKAGAPRKGCKILKPRVIPPSPAIEKTLPVQTNPEPITENSKKSEDVSKGSLEDASKENSEMKLPTKSTEESKDISVGSDPLESETINPDSSQIIKEMSPLPIPDPDTEKVKTEVEPVSALVKPDPVQPITHQPRTLTSFDSKTITEKLESGGWDVLLSENSEDDDILEELKPKKPRIIGREAVDKRLALKDHDYTYNSFQISRLPPTPPPQPAPPPQQLPPPAPLVSLLIPKHDDLSEMDKIANNVAMGVNSDDEIWSKKESKKKKKKRKKHKRRRHNSSESDGDTPMASSTPAFPRGPKPKYHTSITGHGVTAGAARPRFSSSSDSDASSADTMSDQDLATSDYDTDFSADEAPKTSISALSSTISISTKPSAVTPLLTSSKRTSKPTAKIAALKLLDQPAFDEPSPKSASPNVTLKIKMPPIILNGQGKNPYLSKSLIKKSAKKMKLKGKKRPFSLNGFASLGQNGPSAKRQRTRDSSTDSDSSEGELRIVDKYESRRFQPVETEKIFCICRGVKDSSSEMIGCDGQNCVLEWFHFECVGIKQPPAGKWYCPDCRRRYGFTENSFLV